MDAAGWIEAGGLVPPDATLPQDLVTDTVDARGYRHPGMPDRVVVRLVPDAIAMGVDTEMDLLGFSLAVHDDDIARQRHRTLGFPGWALVNDPKRARQALETMKAFRVEAKRALSKPGHAKDGFQAIADGLARTVPHFLPSFWEQAGRAFVDAGNPKMAATMFDKARTAEREYGLTIDEQVRADAFLEFALAGAITVKSLQGWARELAASEGPVKAYDRFYALAVRRTLGGMPPWAGVAKDLRGLAKAAKKDVALEDERFVSEVLTAPSLERAPSSFWDDYGEAVVRAAKRDPAVSKQLLDRFPSGGGSRWSGVSEDFADTWLELLHDAGALQSLWDGDPPVERGGWLARAVEWAPGGHGALLQIVRAMAPAILADGKPLRFGDEDGWTRLAVDLVDLIIELGLPIADPGELYLDLGDWGEGEPVPERWGLPAEHRPRDPVHLVAHPELGARLVGAVGEEMGETAFEAASRDSKALATARRDWLSQQIDHILGEGVPSAEKALETLSEKTSAATFSPWPELRERLAGADVAQALAASLHVGLADELCWPEWDAAQEELGQEDVTIGGPLPFTVLASSRRAIVLGPDGARIAAMDLKLKKDEEVRAVAWIDGHLLLAFQNSDYDTVGRWMPGAAEPFSTSVPYWENVVRIGIPAPGGGVGCGGPPVRPGDPRWPEAHDVYTDGVNAWTYRQGNVHRLDPATGTPGAIERPAWLDDVQANWLDDCQLYPAPASSPLGAKDGLYGWRLRGEGPLVFEGIDGRSIDRTVGDDERPHALATWPGDPRPRPLYRERWGEEGVHVCSPDGWLASTQPEASSLPLSRWHWLRPRDPAASTLLRTFPVERARLLLDACLPSVDSGEEPTAAVAPLLTDVADPRLRAAIAALALRAAGAEFKLRELLSGRADEAEGGSTSSGPSTSDAREALGVLMAPGWGDDELGDAIRTGFRFLRTGEGGARVRWTEIDWPSWYGTAKALGWAAARAGATAAHRRTLQQLYRTWVDAGGCEPMHLRRATWSFDRIDAPLLRTKFEDGEKSLQEHWTVNEETFRALVWTDDTWSDEGPFTVETLEWSASGEFPEHAGATRSEERRWSEPAVDPEWIERMIAAIEAHGERVPTDEEVELVMGKTGLGRGGAVLLLAGAPNMRAYGKDFLGKEIRTTLGLKVAEASAGKDALGSVGTDDWLTFLGAAMPEDPAEIWGPSAPGRIAEAWLVRFGTRIAIPDEVRLQADKELPDASTLALLAAPEADARLRGDGAYEIDSDGDIQFKGEGDGFDGDLCESLATLVPWAFGALPVGDPLRANIGKVIAAVAARLASPGFVVSAGEWWPDNDKKVKTLMSAVGGTVTSTGDADERVDRHDTGPVVVVKGDGVKIAIRPARMDDAAWALVDLFLGGLGEPDYNAQAGSLRTLSSPGFRAFADRVANTPVPVGGWEQDPAASVPDLVAEVAATKKLTPDAARLYLQTLALHQPTKKNVLKWNGWAPKVYDAAAAALVDAKLALEGKRPRAGRDHFLPGAWLERKGPDLPLERWKLPLYGGSEDKGGVRFPLQVIVPPEPFHRLFAAAWERVRAGDAPKFG